MTPRAIAAWLLVFAAGAAAADPPSGCSHCAAWNASQEPFRIYGNTYYVGPHGLASILVASKDGSVLIDGALPESAAGIMAHIRALGFHPSDVKVILNTHVHFDHAGGIAELQRLTGARVVASEATAKVLRHGGVGADDPQSGSIPGIAPAKNVEIVKDGETLHVGPLALTAHATPGHTPGGTTWTWRSCENGRCLDLVYADSLSPIASTGFLFGDPAHAAVLASFGESFTTIAALPCDILLTPHPEASGLWSRLARRDKGDRDALVDPAGCRRLVEDARSQLAARIDGERSGRIR